MRQFFDDILNWYFGLSSGIESSNTKHYWRLEAAWNWQTLPILTCIVIAFLLMIWLLHVSLRQSSKKLLLLLSTIRLTIFVLLLLVLLQVQFKTIRYGKPDLVLLVDSSASMSHQDRYSPQSIKRIKQIGLSKFSERRISVLRALFQEDNSNWLRTLSEKYHLRLVCFDSQLRDKDQNLELILAKNLSDVKENRFDQMISTIEADGASTDYQKALEQLSAQSNQQPPTAVILFTDGKATAHPDSAINSVQKKFRRMKIPVYSVGFGAPESSLDLVIDNVDYEPVGFAGDQHPLTISISSNEEISTPIELVVRELVSEKVLNKIVLDPFSTTTETRKGLTIPQLVVGRNELEVEMSSSVGERNKDNNRQIIRVYGREKNLSLLVIEQDPRWEFRHLKSVLERDRNLTLHTFLLEGDAAFAVEDRTALSQFPEKLDLYDTVIIGNVDFSLLPSSFESEIEKFVENQGGLLLLSSIRSMETLDLTSTMSEIHPSIGRGSGNRNRYPVKTKITSEGSAQRIFPILDNDENRLPLPVLYPPSFELRVKPSVLTLMDGKSEETHFETLPLIMSMRYGSGIVVQHIVDDIWRWKVLDKGNYFRKFWAQSIRNLCRQKLMNQLPSMEIYTDRIRYQSIESANIYLVDRQRKLSKQSEIVAIWNHDGEVGGEILLERTKSDDSIFRGTLKSLIPGRYTILLPEAEQEPSALQTDFDVIQSNLEEKYFPLQEKFMRNLSVQTGGQFYFPWEIDQLPQDLPDRQYTSNSEQLMIPLWNRWELLLPIIILFGLEWSIRRRSGLD